MSLSSSWENWRKRNRERIDNAALQDLSRWFQQCDIKTIIPPEAQIEELERRYAIVLPDAFKAYLLSSCPVERALDNEMTSWWSLECIKNIPHEYRHEVSNPQIADARSQYLFFADYSFWCWAWAIACTNDGNRGKVAVIGGRPDHFVAVSFSEFLQKYLSDPNSVFPT